ncbi:hypothetical protein HC028_21185 [Planosporangium flavigriseum]|uniref:Uncharacterized protein n=1 Tax=Planosporangium flavigriseum TaxID=373681 RepID=A0A8J3LNW8_9ACTN|nr:hypothetical protein [Planosporangium flavigriseum]NJC66998.1 hypothetical protein [Planosporangium flavigriseum]GIG73933.1 hypothetical protein Pfl04_23370 [Planosporangium flavigriseum]
MSAPIFPESGGDGPNEVGPSVEPFVVDHHLVNKIKAQAIIDAGYCREQDGQVYSDEMQLKVAMLEAMINQHVAKGQRDLAKRAITKFELYAEMLPNAPGVESLPRTPEEAAAQDQLKKTLWSWLNAGTTGYVQVRVAELGYVLCEAPVSRTKVNEETGRREPTTETGRFLTTNRQLILNHYTTPAGTRFLAAARKLDAQLGLVTARRPELAEPIEKQLSVVLRQALESIRHADVRQAAALTRDHTDDAEQA